MIRNMASLKLDAWRMLLEGLSPGNKAMSIQIDKNEVRFNLITSYPHIGE